MNGRGVPNDLSYICIPNKEDLIVFNEMIENDRRISYVH